MKHKNVVPLLKKKKKKQEEKKNYTLTIISLLPSRGLKIYSFTKDTHEFQ